MTYYHPDEKLPGHLPSRWAFLRPLARQLGFAAVGVAPAGPVSQSVADHYRRWIANGYFANIRYMTRHWNQRIDPSHPKILEKAQAVVVASLPYGQGAIDRGLWRYVAAHARARDYHKTVKNLLKELVRSINAHFPECRCRVFVDSAPLMERTWALSSRIGSLGKNGAIVVPGVGSRVVLGEIVCSSVPSPSPVDPPQPFDLCNDCEICIAACPTGAFVAPAVVDCRHCLSYWTVEHRGGALPPDIVQKSALIFGCDRCTSVCPHERLDLKSSLEPPPNPGPADLELEDLARMDEQDLEELISKTPLARTGQKAIRRNALAVLQRGEV